MIDPRKIRPQGLEWANFYDRDPETGRAVFSQDRLRQWQEEQARQLESEEE